VFGEIKVGLSPPSKSSIFSLENIGRKSEEHLTYKMRKLLKENLRRVLHIQNNWNWICSRTYLVFRTVLLLD
jgi:hypothetical protein